MKSYILLALLILAYSFRHSHNLEAEVQEVEEEGLINTYFCEWCLNSLCPITECAEQCPYKCSAKGVLFYRRPR